MNEHEAVVTTISHILGLLIWSTDLLCLLCGSGPVFLLYLGFLTYGAGEQRSNPAATETTGEQSLARRHILLAAAGVWSSLPHPVPVRATQVPDDSQLLF